MSKDFYSDIFRQRIETIKASDANELARQARNAKINSSHLLKYFLKPDEIIPVSNSTTRNSSELLISKQNISPETRELQLKDIVYNVESIGAILANSVAEEDIEPRIRPMLGSHIPKNRRQSGHMIWSDYIKSPNTKYKHGLFIGTVLIGMKDITPNYRLVNTALIPANESDLKQAVVDTNSNELSFAKTYIDTRICNANRSVTDVDLGAGDMNYETHLEHLVDFVIRNRLDRFGQ